MPTKIFPNTPAIAPPPVSRTKGPTIARTHYRVKPLRRHGLHHGNEISKMDGRACSAETGRPLCSSLLS
ncbi:hypothetical protein FQN60_008079 [Etheostoma spectabile]|uniref:Uncharacterized protein n=1 Tax=Etheostoma spectabile TaxID=54343 RepID=A0A5J5CSP2_9PERO|nr:hypothetical protein FQN60_008079 [Etheostoma spectabile]